MSTTEDQDAAPGQAVAEYFWHALQGSGATSTPPGDSGVSKEDIGFINRLAHTAQTVQRLKDTAWWKKPEPTWRDALEAATMGAVFARVARGGSTGILHVHNARGDERYLALAAGQIRAAASPNKSEALGTYLLEHGILNEATAARAQALVAGTAKPVGWALLSLQLVTPERLFRAQQEQSQALVLQLLGWTEGFADFYEAAGVVDLRRVIDASTAVLLRDAFVHISLQDVATLKRLTAPFFQRNDPLLYEPLPESLSAIIDHVDAAIVDCARNSQSPQLLMRAVNGRPPPDLKRFLADAYVLNQLGALSFRSEPRFVRLPTLPMNYQAPRKQTPAATITAPSHGDALAVYQEQKDVLAQVKRSLYAYDPNRAAALLAAFIPKQPAPPAELLAYYAMALLLQGDTARANEQALRALRVNPQEAIAHAAMARVFDTNGNANSAYHRKLALTLAQNNQTWHNEVNAALVLTAKPPTNEMPSDARAVYLWILAVVTGLGLFSASIIFKAGNREYYYVADSSFFFIRRAVLLGVGCLGLLIWTRKSPWRALREMQLRISGGWVLWCILWGLAVGLLSPVQRVTGAVHAVLLLTLFHVLAEEVFFRGFITRMLIDQIDDKRLPLLLSAIVYATYHLSYQSFWFDMGIQPRSFYCGVIAMFAGWPLAWMVRETKGLTAPFLCHLVINGTMMLHSLVARDGWTELYNALF